VIALQVVAAALMHSGGVTELGQLLLSGDQQSGTDALQLSGDQQSGSDCLENKEVS
jgi:hypothetical protein